MVSTFFKKSRWPMTSFFPLISYLDATFPRKCIKCFNNKHHKCRSWLFHSVISQAHMSIDSDSDKLKQQKTSTMTTSRLPKRRYSRNLKCSSEILASAISLVSISENAPLDNFTNRYLRSRDSLNGWGTVESRKSYKRGLHELNDDIVKKSPRHCDDDTTEMRRESKVITIEHTWGFYVEN